MYVLQDQHGPILGRDTISALGMVLDGETISVHEVQSTENSQMKITDLLQREGLENLAKDDIGKFPEYKHTV